MSEMPNREEVVRAADEVDEELLALAEREPPSIVRPILMIGVIVMAAWVLSDWTEQLRYFFSPSEPMELGDVTEFASEVARDPSWEPPIEHNRYVSLEGIPSRRSQSARYRYAKLVGTWIFVEQPRDDLDRDPLEVAVEGEAKADIDRTYFQETGRMLKFSEMPKRYHGLRSYYASRYNLRFCETLTPRELAELEARRRETIVEEWRREYEEATPEQRAEQALTPSPPAGEVERILKNHPACVDAYLVQVGVKPRDHYWYVGAGLLFVGFMLFNMVMLVRWVRDFLRFS